MRAQAALRQDEWESQWEHGDYLHCVTKLEIFACSADSEASFSAAVPRAPCCCCLAERDTQEETHPRFNAPVESMLDRVVGLMGILSFFAMCSVQEQSMVRLFSLNLEVGMLSLHGCSAVDQLQDEHCTQGDNVKFGMQHITHAVRNTGILLGGERTFKMLSMRR